MNVDGVSPNRVAEDPNVFNADKLPQKIPIVKPDGCTSGNVIVYHAEAAYQVRKYIFEQAKKTYKEVEKSNTSELLSHSHQRTRELEDRFEEYLLTGQGYGKGNMHTDLNSKILFKTFLNETSNQEDEEEPGTPSQQQQLGDQ